MSDSGNNTSQTVGINTLLSDSSGEISKEFTQVDAANRLSTVANILSQKFGSYWKLILILIILLVAIVFVIILMLY
jgi:hypothetical protein